MATVATILGFVIAITISPFAKESNIGLGIYPSSNIGGN